VSNPVDGVDEVDGVDGVDVRGASAGRPTGQGVYYGWVVVAITFVTLLVSAGVRAAPGVLMAPLERDQGWDRAAIAAAIAVGLLLYGLAGPFSGHLMDRFGTRALMLAGLALMAVSTAASAAMTALWQLAVLWGVLSGIGTGLTAHVLGATVATRWFVARRGLVLGIFGAASSMGQLVIVPLLMGLVVAVGWRGSALGLAALVVIVLVPVGWLMRDAPASLGPRPAGSSARPAVPATAPGGAMARALRTPEFWLLAGSFAICGATTNGLVSTHLIAHSLDHGVAEMAAAGALALMGSMNVLGGLTSGWLTDRVDPRKLLAGYYTARGLSLVLLPFVTDGAGLALFAILFGLDYVATIPPTAALTADIFGRQQLGLVFGWIFCAHQIGSALAAYLGGLARVALGDYQIAFLTAGALAALAAMLAMSVGRRGSPGRALAGEASMHNG
jgi:sugar phosphate permease